MPGVVNGVPEIFESLLGFRPLEVNPAQRIQDGLVAAIEVPGLLREGERAVQVFSPQGPEPGGLVQENQALTFFLQRPVGEFDERVEQKLDLPALAALKVDAIVDTETGRGLELGIFE